MPRIDGIIVMTAWVDRAHTLLLSSRAQTIPIPNHTSTFILDGPCSRTTLAPSHSYVPD